jgi:MFS family permease
MLRNVQAEVKQRHTVAERESLREEIGGGSDEQIISRIAQDQMAWVLTSYMTPLTGWLAGRFGIKYVFLISVAGFTLA